ncbi:MAG: N-acetylmuramic acid 6-phosphate etherase [Chloroflexi bacterium ADurb.Bin325]|nr:MAG: N-acetylmuramic acid 6-phosphate etherase [Chloroflexi bacterium ADurb.Bin325]
MDLTRLTTEQRNPATAEIDRLSALEIVTLINREDMAVPAAIAPCLPVIAALVEATVARLQRGGRLVYIGAGTSGRLGVLDASECPPTYGVDTGLVVGLMAGGDHALRNSIEGVEDDEAQGAADVQAIGLSAADVLVGVAASGRTPYTLAALRYARSVGAAVGCIVNSPGSPMAEAADYPIVVVTGPEVVTGSTRMKAGTAQKLVLNMLSTATMIRLGKVYGNLMVDVQPSNHKLVQRARNIVAAATAASAEEAAAALERYGSTKAAILGLLTGLDAPRVRELLTRHAGRLRDAIDEFENA